MSRNGWENGQRVPVTDDLDREADPAPERAALVMVRRLVGLMLADGQYCQDKIFFNREWTQINENKIFEIKRLW